MFSDALNRAQRNLENFRIAINNPSLAQERLLKVLLKDYSKTGYGESYGLEEDMSPDEFLSRIPIADYSDFNPFFLEVRHGDYRVLLDKKPITWVMTRGTTGKSKIIPITDKHMNQIVTGGSRAILNYAFNKGGFDTLMGGVLNLQFPSNNQSMKVGNKKIVFGFSSGTYARLNPMMAGLRLIPRQEEIDSLETGLSISDWEKRYECIYQKSKDENIVSIIGVAPVQTGFARYLKKTHGVYPKEIWEMKVLYTTSVAKIQTKYKPLLQKMYGAVSLVEMYTATEGAFGQQMDNYPYWRPNYDLYFFEVFTNRGSKMLYDLRRGEWGRIIISTPILPRYSIGDLVESMGNNYFRIFGRNSLRTVVEHKLYRTLFGWAI